MKRGFSVAAAFLLAALAAGCGLKAGTPAFLLPGGASASHAGASAAPQASAAPSVTPQASATASPAPSAAPTVPPAAPPAPSAPVSPYPVLATYQSTLPAGLKVALKYNRYATPMDYFVALKAGRVTAKPDAKSPQMARFSVGSRYRVDALVVGADGKSKWFRVLWTDKNGAHTGFASASVGSVRSFRVGRMLDEANKLTAEADKPGTVYIMNYKNTRGLPPLLPGGGDTDARGNRRSMSAPAYMRPDLQSAFVYAPDGLLGTEVSSSGGFTQIYFPSFGQTLWVPGRYVSKSKDAIPALTQLVVVDRLYQNSGTFEFVGGAWQLVALTYVSTGKSGGFYTKTPLGDFMAQERVTKFYYYYDGTQKIEGYAPWAVRFSGGGYLHGVPRKSQYDAAGHRTDLAPGEALSTLGTTPQSHMCVRNYTSYAKFVYDWYKQGQCAVVVFE